jgi:hypothetical protein
MSGIARTSPNFDSRINPLGKRLRPLARSSRRAEKNLLAYYRPGMPTAYRGTLADMFAVLSMPRPRVLRLVCRVDNNFHADTAFAFACEPAILLRVSQQGFRVLRTRGVGRSVACEPAFSAAVLRLLWASVSRPPPEPRLTPPGTRQRRACR